MTQDRQIFEPDGRAVAYIDEGAGPTVVLLPAAGLDFAYLGTLASILVEEDFRVIRIGPRATAADSLHDLAQDVVDVLDALGVASAWIGGHAFGGAVARTVAIDHHDHVDGILLLGVDDGAPVDRTAALTAVFGADYTPDADLESRQSAALAATPTAEWAQIAADTPTLVIQADGDEITPPANGFALQASAPALVSVKSVDGAGHLFALTHPGETSWFIEDYLDWD